MKNIITIGVGCVAGICLLGAVARISYSEYEEMSDRVAALEQQNNDLKGELNSTTDAMYYYKAETASLNDAIIEVNEEIKQLKESSEDNEESEEDEDSDPQSFDESKIPDSERIKKATVEKNQNTLLASAVKPKEEETFAVYEDVTPIEEEPVVAEATTEGYSYYASYQLTAYCATGNPCADGAYPSVGYTVASNDPNLWHKWIYIEGVGDRYVHDTGGMASTTIDVFVGSYDEAIQFGRWSANIYVYN